MNNNAIDNSIFDKAVGFHGTKGLVFINDKIIVFRRDDKTKMFPLRVDLPGGGREADESAFGTFKREVKEEFGLDLKETDVVYSKKYPSILDAGNIAYFIVTKSLNISESDIVFGNEGVGFMLMTPEEFVGLADGVIYQQKRVVDYLKFLKS